MKEIMILCALMTASLLYGFSERRYAPDGLSPYEAVTADPKAAQNENISLLSKTEPQTKEPVMMVNGVAVDVSWEENETVAELLAYAQNETITVHSTIYGGFEQVGSLPRSFSRSDVAMTTDPGDIVLYSGNQLVMFFGSNSWSYTKLGHINLTAEKLTELLGGDLAVIEIKYE